MTFWQFFSEHPFVGFLVSAMAVFFAATTAETLIVNVAAVLRARYGGCDCVPCDREHTDDADPEVKP